MEKEKEIYLKPKDMSAAVGVSVYLLRYYRQRGALTKIRWSFGGRKPWYELNEVKKLFNKD